MARPPGRRWRLGRIALADETEEATATGIYGVVVGGSVMAASHARTAVGVALTVLITLTIYWSAERFARVVADRIHRGYRPGPRHLLAELTAGWEIVSASTLPLIVLVVTRLLGRTLDEAIIAALVCSTLLLCLAGWEMGRHGRLSRLERAAVTAVAGLFGVLLMALKAVPH